MLQRPIGGRTVHEHQLLRLLRIGQLRMELQVMPTDREEHPDMDGAFILLTPKGRQQVAYTEVNERHISGTAPGGHGDLMPPTATRAQVQAAAEKLVEKGTRVSDPARTLQTFEKRMTVNGMRANYRLIVDSTDRNRIIAFFLIGNSYTP